MGMFSVFLLQDGMCTLGAPHGVWEAPTQTHPRFHTSADISRSRGSSIPCLLLPKGKKDGAEPCLPFKHLSEELVAPSAVGNVGIAGFGSQEPGSCQVGGLGMEFLWLQTFHPHHGVWRSHEQSWEQLLGLCLEPSRGHREHGKDSGMLTGKEEFQLFQEFQEFQAGRGSILQEWGWVGMGDTHSAAPNLLDLPEKFKPGAGGMR